MFQPRLETTKEPNNTVLKNKRGKCSNKITHNDLLLNSEISALFGHHQKSFLQQKVGTNMESTARHYTDSETVKPKWVVSPVTALNEMSPSNSSPRSSEKHAEEEAERM